MVTAQLPLCIGLRDEATFSNFYPGQNRELITQLQQQLDDGGEMCIYVWGQLGSGRSHLLQAACHRAVEHGKIPFYLDMTAWLDYQPDILHDLEQTDLVCIDNLEAVAGKPAWEEALFHLFNRLRAAQGHLLLAAHHAAIHVPIALRDLKSRLSWGLVLQCLTLTDEEKLHAMQLRAKARGLTLPRPVAQYLINHCSRDTQALFCLLEQLDQASLATQRPLTIPLIKSVLNQH